MAWVPLESNPDALNAYVTASGFRSCPLRFVDCFGVSEDLLPLLPRPVFAFLLVFPITAATEEDSKTRAAQSREQAAAIGSKIVFMKQYIPNACGTVGLLHALANNKDKIGPLAPDAPNFVKSIVGELTSCSAGELGEMLKDCEGLSTVHEQCATAEGSTAINMNVNLHFACYVAVGGYCVELDGRQEGPIIVGPAADNEAFITAAAAAIQAKMNLCPESLEFGITALVEASEE